MHVDMKKCTSSYKTKCRLVYNCNCSSLAKGTTTPLAFDYWCALRSLLLIKCGMVLETFGHGGLLIVK